MISATETPSVGGTSIAVVVLYSPHATQRAAQPTPRSGASTGSRKSSPSGRNATLSRRGIVEGSRDGEKPIPSLVSGRPLARVADTTPRAW